VEEKSGLLGGEPFSEVLVSAVGESADEMTLVVISLSHTPLASWGSHKLIAGFIIETLDVELVLS